MGDDFDPEPYRRSMALNLDGVVYGIAAATGHPGQRGRHDRGHRLHGRARRRPVRSHLRGEQARHRRTRPVARRDLCRRGHSHPRSGPSFAATNIIKGSEQTLIDMGFPILDVADVVSAFQRILDSDGSGQCWYVVAGRQSEPFGFRRPRPRPTPRLTPRVSPSSDFSRPAMGPAGGRQPRTADSPG